MTERKGRDCVEPGVWYSGTAMLFKTVGYIMIADVYQTNHSVVFKLEN